MYKHIRVALCTFLNGFRTSRVGRYYEHWQCQQLTRPVKKPGEERTQPLLSYFSFRAWWFKRIQRERAGSADTATRWLMWQETDSLSVTHTQTTTHVSKGRHAPTPPTHTNTHTNKHAEQCPPGLEADQRSLRHHSWLSNTVKTKSAYSRKMRHKEGEWGGGVLWRQQQRSRKKKNHMKQKDRKSERWFAERDRAAPW